MIEPLINRFAAAPEIRVFVIGDALARFDLAHKIGAAADRGAERGLLEARGIGRVGGQHRHQSKNERQLLIVLLPAEADGQRVEEAGLGDLAIGAAIIRAALFLQQAPGEGDIAGRDRLPVAEAGRRVHIYRQGMAVGLGGDAGRNPRIKREGLVGGAQHQALEDEAHRRADPLCADPAHHEGVERVKTARHPEGDPSAIRRGAGGIGQGRVGRQARCAVQTQPV